MLSRTLLATAAATAATAAALTLPGGAAAQQGPIYEVDYRVDFDVTATWELSRWEERGAHWKQDADFSAKTRLTGYLEHVLFRNGKLVTQTNQGIVDQEASGTGFIETHTFSPIDQKWFVDRNDCDAGHDIPLASSHLQAHPEGGLVFRPAEVAPLGYVCETGNEGMFLGIPGQPLGGGTFDARFTLPNEAVGMGTIIQHVKATPAQSSPAYCPAKDEFVTSCEFGWEGKLTFTRMEEHQYTGAPGTGPDDGAPELPPQPSPPPGTDPRAEAVKTAVEQYQPGRDPRAEAIAAAVEQYVSGDLKLQPGCAGACTGTAGLLIGGARTPVTTVKFSVKDGQKAVRLKLSAKAKRALKRAKSAKLKVTTKPRGGGKATTRTLRVKG